MTGTTGRTVVFGLLSLLSFALVAPAGGIGWDRTPSVTLAGIAGDAPAAVSGTGIGWD